MKKLLSIVAFCAATLTFTSCNTGESNTWTPLTPTEKASCFAQTSGSYSGKMVYYNANESTTSTSSVTDTLNVNWTIGTGVGSDTTMTVTNLPVKVFAKYIPDEKVSKALAAYEAPVPFKNAMYFYQTSPAPTFLLVPEIVKIPITYDGGSHTLSLYFYQSTLSSVTSYGYYYATTKQLVMSIVLGGYELDATDTTSNVNKLEYKVSGKTFSYAPLQFIAQK